MVKREDGPDLRVQGNIVDHEYTIEQDGAKVAEVSKRWFRVRDTYGVEVAPGENDVLILAITAVVDNMAHPGQIAAGRSALAHRRALIPRLATTRPRAYRRRLRR